MQRKFVLLLICIMLSGAAMAVQKKKSAGRKVSTNTSAKRTEAAPAAKTSPVIGTTVNLITRNGDKLSGELLDLSAYSLRLKSGNLESTISLETLAAISFDASKLTESKPSPPISENFINETTMAFKAFQTMETETKGGSDYTEYGRQLTELRRGTEKFIQRYSGSENATEARIVALLSGAMIDYTWARTIWTLKLGGNGTVSETENPVVADTLALYATLRTVTAVGDRFSADKLIGNLWKKASEKIAKARDAITQ